MRMVPRLAACAVLLVTAAWAAAPEPPAPAPRLAVAELFTSQGCSSCPKADAFMPELARLPGVLVLTYNVDLWDYLGWRDVFALPGNLDRLKAYAGRLDSNHVYTPQLVVDGAAATVGNRHDAVLQLVTERATHAKPARVTLALNGETLSVRIAGAAAPLKTPATVWLVRILLKAEAKVTSGENAGMTIQATNLVRDLDPAGLWTGAPLVLDLPQDATGSGPFDAYAVLVQAGETGEILGAAMIPLRP